jgi:hypothetical protein
LGWLAAEIHDRIVFTVGRMTAMDTDTFGMIVEGGAVLALIFISVYFLYRRRRRSKRLLVTVLLKRYFQGEVPADQLAKRTRKIIGRYFMPEGELYALVVAAFQGAVDASPADQAPSKEGERKLLGLLAALKRELGLADLYRIEGWRSGRE